MQFAPSQRCRTHSLFGWVNGLFDLFFYLWINRNRLTLIIYPDEGHFSSADDLELLPVKQVPCISIWDPGRHYVANATALQQFPTRRL